MSCEPCYAAKCCLKPADCPAYGPGFVALWLRQQASRPVLLPVAVRKPAEQRRAS